MTATTPAEALAAAHNDAFLYKIALTDEDARVILALLDGAGWALVLKVATEAMIEMGQTEVNIAADDPKTPNAYTFLARDEIAAIYAAMLAARPK